jgi:hypothetical protein
MQLRAAIGAAAVLTMLLSGSTLAACTVAVSTPGILTLSSDGTKLSSQTGVASVMTISNLSLFGSTITISAPQLTGGPVVPGAVLEESYSASWLLGVGSSNSGGFVSTSRSFAVPGVASLVVTIILDNRVTSASGFSQGTYTSKTAVDCT